MNVITRAWASFKAAASSVMHFGSGSRWGRGWIGSTTYDYAAAAGDGRGNAAVMACIRWAQRALPEAPLQVMQRNAAGELQPMPGHALQDRLENPNPHYSGLHLLGALVADLMLTGNAYLRKIRAGGPRGRVVQLWWIPSWMIEPAWPDNDSSVFIGWYDYTVDGQVDALDPADVVHIRQGFDPQNIRKGLSDIAALIREIATDNEAANWTASMVRNVTPPGVVVVPGKDVAMTSEDAEQIKGEFAARFGGDNRGAALVLSAEADVRVLSYSPEQMNLRALRQIPEERITAVLGIPAAVVGLGAGLDTTKVGATMREMREQAYESCLIPLQRLIISELQMQLVPDFGDPAKLRVQFDLTQVRVLQDDQNALHERARADLLAGLLTLNQALQMVGEDPLTGTEGDVRYVPNTVTVKTLETLIPPTVAPASLPAPADGQPPTPTDAAGAAPQKALVAAGAQNGHANGKATLGDLGPALILNEEDLDRLSKVSERDVPAAERFWRQVTEGSDFEELMNAEPDEDDAR